MMETSATPVSIIQIDAGISQITFSVYLIPNFLLKCVCCKSYDAPNF